MGPPPCTWMPPFLPFLPFPLLPFGPLLVFVFPISIFLPVVASIAVRSWHGNIGGARQLAQKIKRLIGFKLRKLKLTGNKNRCRSSQICCLQTTSPASLVASIRRPPEVTLRV